MSSIAGELVTETFEYDGGRQVTVYVPPKPPEAVVFAGDGQLISQWGRVLEAAISESFRREHPVRTVDTYGRRPASRPADSAFDKDVLEQLKSLGYIQ